MTNKSTFIDAELAKYFFGNLFDVRVAETALVGTPQGQELVSDIIKACDEGHPHTGVWLVCYKDLDRDLFMAFLQVAKIAPSMISFYATSNHRYFGGTTLMCVPFQYCINAIPKEGEYLVYRHTYKEPISDPAEIGRIMASGTVEQKLNAMILRYSRDGYRTIPGMSYVGMTKRSWSKRYDEHVESALENSSSTLFHQAIRDMQGKSVICVHDVSGFGMTKKDAKKHEKNLIRTSTLAPLGLNMKVG